MSTFNDAAGLVAALCSERKKTFIETGSCNALGGECRFLYPYNSHSSGEFWTSPTPKTECASSGCPYWENQSQKREKKI
jgi:hypothetical protein